MQTEFAKTDMFDPAQLNLLIMNSGMTYQYIDELLAKKTQQPETAFGYLAEQSLQKTYDQKAGIKNVTFFPFTASFMSADDGLVQNIENEENLQAYHEAELIEQKVRLMDDKIEMQQIDPLMDNDEILKMFQKLQL